MYKIVITTCTEIKYNIIDNNECGDNGIDIDNDNDNDSLIKIMTETANNYGKIDQ